MWKSTPVGRKSLLRSSERRSSLTTMASCVWPQNSKTCVHVSVSSFNVLKMTSQPLFSPTVTPSALPSGCPRSSGTRLGMCTRYLHCSNTPSKTMVVRHMESKLCCQKLLLTNQLQAINFPKPRDSGSNLAGNERLQRRRRSSRRKSPRLMMLLKKPSQSRKSKPTSGRS